MVTVKSTIETRIPPVVLFFLIGLALIVLAAKISDLLGPGITIFFYVIGFIIVGSILYSLFTYQVSIRLVHLPPSYLFATLVQIASQFCKHKETLLEKR